MGDDSANHPLAICVQALLGQPFADGNRVRRLKNGNEIFPAMLDAIAAAEHSIEFLTYVYWSGSIAATFAQALADAAERDVDVRVLLDGFGAQGIDDEAKRILETSGCEVSWFRQLHRMRFWRNNHRTHRKVMVVDADIGFCGGVGIAEEWNGDARNPDEYRDDHFEIRGPAASQLRAAFLDNWLEENPNDLDLRRLDHRPAASGSTKILVIRSTANAFWSEIATTLHVVISEARESLDISTPYLVLDRATTDLLLAALQRRVHVRVLVPGDHQDKMVSELAGSEYIEELLEAGIELYRFQPTFIHLKTFLIDGTLALVASPNLNQRSLRKDDEVCLLIPDEECAGLLCKDFEADLALSEQVSNAEWARRGLGRRAVESVTTIFKENF